MNAPSSLQELDTAAALNAIARIRELLDKYQVVLASGARIKPYGHGAPMYRKALDVAMTYLSRAFNAELASIPLAPTPQDDPKEQPLVPTEQLVTDEGALLIRRASR